MEFIEQNGMLKRHFFSGFFDKNSYLDNLNPVEYFEGLSH